MKKLIVIGMTLACATLGVYAQGTVTFGNTTSTLVRYAPGVPGHTNEAVPIGSMRVALYWGTLGSPEANLVQIGAFTGIVGQPGFFFGGNRTTPTNTAAGTQATFQARAWSAAFATYEAAIGSNDPNQFAGKSVVFNSQTGGGGSPPGPPFNLAPVIPVVSVLQVPEPSVIALGLLGLGSLLLIRRRK